MHIALFGITGTIGSRIAAEALARNHTVTGVVRDATRATDIDPRITLAVGDVTNPADVARIVRDADAVISAVGNTRVPAGTAPVPLFARAAHALLAGTRDAGVKRLLVLGGAGSLEVAPGVAAVDTPNFPDAYRGDALGQRDALAVYRSDEARDIDWTYISPAGMIAPGERTGVYRTGGDAMLFDANGESRISAEDYAAAMIEELEQARNPRRRITVAY